MGATGISPNLAGLERQCQLRLGQVARDECLIVHKRVPEHCSIGQDESLHTGGFVEFLLAEPLSQQVLNCHGAGVLPWVGACHAAVSEHNLLQGAVSPAVVSVVQHFGGPVELASETFPLCIQGPKRKKDLLRCKRTASER